MGLILPEHYDPRLSVRETQEAIKYIRDTFQKEFGKEMNLERISAPLFVEKSSGLNDDLNGVERPVQFDIAGVPGETIEVVHSLAKWKRMALYKYGFQPGEGLYTNMNAIRRDEELDNLHSCYVDQWDWEKVIKKEERTVETLETTVRNIFKIIKHMEHEVWYKYPQAVKKLPEDIYFITSQELEDMYPDKTPKERENLITKEHGCVFLMKIGDKLASGEPHDGRAPDYDDWQLNGDILFWFETLNCALEISSMGIRVDEKALEEQLVKAGCEERKNLPYHKMLLNGELPYTIGGGIGQSRLCMLLLDRAHVGEVQASLWPEEMREAVLAIREKMAAAAREAGRDPAEVQLCAACKTRTAETVAASAALPIDVFGENHVQELCANFDAGAYCGKPSHFIGHLQTNKIKKVLGRASLIQSVGSEHLLTAIEKEAAKAGIVQNVLLEVNIGGEESKSGVSPEALWPLLDAAAAQEHIRVKGLMAIPPVNDDDAQNRRYLAAVHDLFVKAGERGYSNVEMQTLSMGMSGDYENAIREGATLVRIGTAIYGERDYSKK